MLIAEEIANKTNLELVNNCLIKTKNIIEQSKLNKEDRLQNIQGVYSLQNERLITNKKILLLDDIYTTGNTIDCAARELKKAGVQKVYFLTISIGQGY